MHQTRFGLDSNLWKAETCETTGGHRNPWVGFLMVGVKSLISGRFRLNLYRVCMA